MPQIATQITHGTLDADVVISTKSIRVHNILVSNNSAGNVEAIFKIGDGTGDQILYIATEARASRMFVGKWVADNGLSVDSLANADISVTVIHSSALGGV